MFSSRIIKQSCSGSPLRQYCVASSSLKPGHFARRSLTSSSKKANTNLETLKQATEDAVKIDQLLSRIRANTSSNERAAISMVDKGSWKGVHQTPWSFSYDPALPESTIEAASAPAPEEPAVQADPTPLKAKRMHESYVEISLPLASNPDLLNQYISTSGGIRMGKVLEHIDSLAGAVAYKHALPVGTGRNFAAATKKEAIYLATAGADRLDMFSPLIPQDLRLSGHVVFVGSSSMEVAIKVEGLSPEKGADGFKTNTLLLGRFTMVARDSNSHKARKINPLLIETEDEQTLYQMGKEHKDRRAHTNKNSLTKVPPTPAEMTKLHSLMLSLPDDLSKGVILEGEEVVEMGSEIAGLKASYLIHPQERNLHGRAFGGFLMRLAYELAYGNSVLYGKHSMRFLALDEISFKLPVPIGSVLHLTSLVIASSTPAETGSNAQVHVQVTAEISDVQTGERQTTNDFHFTFCKDGGVEMGRVVVPRTYKECMRWLDGKRRLETGMSMRKLYGIEV